MAQLPWIGAWSSQRAFLPNEPKILDGKKQVKFSNHRVKNGFSGGQVLDQATGSNPSIRIYKGGSPK
jgi:hypothetical protein